MAYAGYNVLNFGGYSPGGSPTGTARTPGFSSPFLNNPSQGQQGYNPNWDPINWNPNLANAMKWLGYSPAQERQSIISPYQTPGGSFSGPSAPPATTATTPTAPTAPTNPVTTAPAPTTPPNNSNDYWSTIHPILGGPIGTGATSSGVTATSSSGGRVPGGVGGVIDYTQPARTTTSPSTTAAPGPSPNSDFLGALQTAIDSLGNLGPNVSPINPNPSTDYSFNANAPSDVANNWSSYVNMLGYNRL